MCSNNSFKVAPEASSEIGKSEPLVNPGNEFVSKINTPLFGWTIKSLLE